MITILKRGIIKQVGVYLIWQVFLILALAALGFFAYGRLPHSSGMFHMLCYWEIFMLWTIPSHNAWIEDYFKIAPMSFEEKKKMLTKAIIHLSLLCGLVNVLTNITIVILVIDMNMVFLLANSLGIMLSHMVYGIFKCFMDINESENWYRVPKSGLFILGYIFTWFGSMGITQKIYATILYIAGLILLITYGVIVYRKYADRLYDYYCGA